MRITRSASGPEYLEQFFEAFLLGLGVKLRDGDEIQVQRQHFFERMQNRVERIAKTEDIDLSGLQSFRQVFRSKTGTVLSTIHGVKGEEYDTVIAFALLADALPHFNEQNKTNAAKRALFVTGSRARRHLYLISENGRLNGIGREYRPTAVLHGTQFSYSDDPVAML